MVRRLLPVVLVIGVLSFLGVELVPPLSAHGKLDQWTLDAAQAAARSAVGGGSTKARAVAQSVADQHHVAMTGFSLSGTTATVTFRQQTHAYLDTLPGLKNWYQVTSTQSSDGGL